jgi:hypothetical protein
VATVPGTPSRRALGLAAARAAALSLTLALLGSCGARGNAAVYIVVGPDTADHVEFRPIASYAEFLVQPGQRRELRITLASYRASCDSFVAPGDADISATVTVIAPDAVDLGPGTYAWAGHAAHGGSEQQPERAYALPTVRVGHRGFVLPPGGEIQLESVTTTQDGRVRGLLAFEFAGDAEHVATSLKGSFEAKLCRVRM